MRKSLPNIERVPFTIGLDAFRPMIDSARRQLAEADGIRSRPETIAETRDRLAALQTPEPPPRIA